MTDRIAIIMPSWVGDLVMATPALRLIRNARPNAEIHAIVRPGLDALLDGAGLVNHIHTIDARGLGGPARLARTLQPIRASQALLLTNSFSTALGLRIARIPRRVGYARDARSLLLTERLVAPREHGHWSLIPAVRYYHHAGAAFLEPGRPPLIALESDSLTHAPLGDAASAHLELGITPQQQAHADEILAKINEPYAILNPGGNNPAKRWPPERFSALADHLRREHNLRVLINGSPAEIDLVQTIVRDARTDPIALPGLSPTLGSLKAIIKNARLMITNDTGPRHIAAAFAVPLVSLFGPTDPRWTTIPVRPLTNGTPSETILIANKNLDPSQTSNADPEGSRIDRIELEPVTRATDNLLNAR
jgi:lipopolysaccharide heptosyltransferase II